MLIKITCQELFLIGSSSEELRKLLPEQLFQHYLKNLFPMSLTGCFMLELPSLAYHMLFVKADSFPFGL